MKLAELCGVSSGTIGNIECGITKPSFDLIIKIAESVKIPPSEFFIAEESFFSDDDKFTTAQYEIVRESFSSSINKFVDEAMKDLKYRIEH